MADRWSYGAGCQGCWKPDQVKEEMQMTDEIWIRKQGDTFIVDTSYRKCIFKASLCDELRQSPEERAEQYVRAAIIHAKGTLVRREIA